jgi:hypothetical protein
LICRTEEINEKPAVKFDLVWERTI